MMKQTGTFRKFLKIAASIAIVILGLGYCFVPFERLEWAMAQLAGAELSMSPTLANVGEGNVGQELQATFKLRNFSGRILKILGMMSSCTCVSSSGLPAEIAPGATQNLSVRFRLEGSPGEMVKQKITYVTDAPTRPWVTVEVQGRLIAKAAYADDRDDILIDR